MEYYETNNLWQETVKTDTFAAITMNPIGTTECGILSYTVTTLVAGNHFKGTEPKCYTTSHLTWNSLMSPGSHKCFLIRIT